MLMVCGCCGRHISPAGHGFPIRPGPRVAPVLSRRDPSLTIRVRRRGQPGEARLTVVRRKHAHKLTPVTNILMCRFLLNSDSPSVCVPWWTILFGLATQCVYVVWMNRRNKTNTKNGTMKLLELPPTSAIHVFRSAVDGQRCGFIA